MRMLGRLLGTSDEHGRQLVAWGDALLGNTDPDFTDFPVDLVDTDEFRMVPFRSPASIEISRFAQEQAVERRQCPRDDVITQLLQPAIDGVPLTDHEFNNFFTLLVATERHDPLLDDPRHVDLHEPSGAVGRPAR